MTDLANLTLNRQICSSSVTRTVVWGAEFVVHFFLHTGAICCQSEDTSPDPLF